MLTCPSCKSGQLQPDELEPGLDARRCPHCRGHWIPFAAYLPWTESGGRSADPDSTPPSELFAPHAQDAGDNDGQTTRAEEAAPPLSRASESGRAARVRLCPECGRFLRRFPLGMGIEFEIERCGGCAGVWCDRGKWTRLRTAGAHSRLHLLFSDSWQAKIKDEQLRRRQEDRVRAILGDEDFTRARDFKDWVDAHPQRATLRAFLAEDFDAKPPRSLR